MPEKPLLSIDLGCGSLKRPGTIGVDVVPHEGVDHVLDFARQPLPFADDSVAFVFSSHCLEHMSDPLPLFREIGRVCQDGAKIELWTPYAWHNNGVLLGHVTHWTHEFYVHVSSLYPGFWAKELGAAWVVDEVVHVVEGHTKRALERRGFDLDFAVEHLLNVVAEIGVLGRIDKSGRIGSVTPARTYAASRADSDAGRRYPLESRSMLKRFRVLWNRVAQRSRSSQWR